MIDILIPTYGRASRLGQVIRNIEQNTEVPWHVYFVIEDDDNETAAAAHEMVGRVPHVDMVFNARTPNYAGAMNTCIPASGYRYWFAGADDLNFHPGWDKAALDALDDQFMVAGTNDLANPFVLEGIHATHYLVDRRYVDTYGGTLDAGPGIAFHEGYDHNYTDTEFIGVAKARARFRPCLDSVVEHMHHEFGKSENDATYQRGIAKREQDQRLYEERKQAWVNLSL